VFQTRLLVEADTRPGYWVVRAPLIWSDGFFGRLAVPEGFLTDLASVPNFLHGLSGFDPTGLSRRPAVVHDWLYNDVTSKRTRAFADEFLRRALIAEGLSATLAGTYYDAVRLFGGKFFQQRPTP